MILRIRWGYIGAGLIACAILIRALAGGNMLQDPRIAAFLTFFYTGKIVAAEEAPPQVQETIPIPEKREDPLQISLQAGLSIAYKNSTPNQIELDALLEMPLEWNLTDRKVQVLILHTHATESYQNTGQYVSSDPYRTTDRDHNMVAVGAHLAQLLQKAGISVIHDGTLHDYPVYSTSYGKARETILRYLENYPEISLVIDLHRDAIADEKGEQLPLTAVHGGKRAAQLALVIGTDVGGQYHPGWKENAALAVKLQTVLEMEFPGICRPVMFRTSRYNQDLTAGSVLVEVGTAGNTLEEALRSVEVLAKAIEKMANGVETVNN